MKLILSFIKKHFGFIAVSGFYLTLFLLLYVIASHNYLLFHVSVEMFTVIVAASIFMFAWNTRKISQNDYFLFLSIAYLFVGGIVFLHTLVYKGVNIIPGFNANLPTQLWIAGRYLLAFSLLISPFFIGKKLKKAVIFILYLVIFTLIVASTFYWKNFPISYVEGVGLTSFKIVSEYIISFLFLISIVILIRVKDKFDKEVFRYLIISLILNIFSELLFTLYVSVYDLFNMLGHLAQFFSYYFIYKAIVAIGLTQPYNLLFLELKELGKRKDDFLSIASHEFKTPVTSIKAYSQILKQQFSKTGDIKKTDFADQISRQADKIADFIDNFMDINKIESGKLIINLSEFDYDDLVLQTISDCQHTSAKHKVLLRGKTGVILKGDRNRIGQVLTNLIVNGIKYCPNGGKIIVNLRKDKHLIITSVRDFGIGIEKNKKSQIFTKYYRTKEGEKNAQGLGLGLYIAREIIKLHSGKIWVESEKNKGTIFYFSLPIE